MRADRLLSILLLLQSRRRMTAAALATELAVSPRTVYRDIDALSAAGVPIYGEPGVGGGFALLDDYRTSLTGLTADEVRALFMMSVPDPLVRLGVGEHLRTALRKLAAALPDARRDDEQRARQRYHLDSSWWQQDDDGLSHMEIVHQAVWGDRRLCVTYRVPVAGDIEAVVEPYGLVAKAGVWYVVFAVGGRPRAERLSAFRDVRLAADMFTRPVGFDLPTFWRRWCSEHEAELLSYRATVRVAAEALPELRRRLGRRVAEADRRDGEPGGEGPALMDLAFESLEEAREQLLGLGRGVEILAPAALRSSVLDYAEQIVALYAGPEDGRQKGAVGVSGRRR